MQKHQFYCSRQNALAAGVDIVQRYDRIYIIFPHFIDPAFGRIDFESSQQY